MNKIEDKNFQEQTSIVDIGEATNQRQTLLTQQQQNLMQLYLASNNLEQLTNIDHQQNKSSIKEIEGDEDDDIDDDEEDEEDDDYEEEKINELNNDNISKYKTLKRSNEDEEEEGEEIKIELSTTNLSLIAAAAVTSSSSSSSLNQSNSTKKSRIAAIPGKPRGATYDGNSCMICSDRASGFHYGVLACEGCKGFFKRICKEPNEMQNKRHCVYGGNCDINLRTRNRCQYCRIQKCIQLGMSKDGIKLGRRSRKFKENLVQIVSSSSSNTLISPTTTITTTASLSNKQQTATTSATTQSIVSTYQDQNSIAAANNNAKLISQMSDLNNKLLNNDRQHSNLLFTNNLQHQQQQQNLIINNGNNINNQIITLNADNQLQQFILPTG
jgi:hypothetical protein